MRRIYHILAILLVTLLVAAGPCPACPAPQPEKSAHDCCPGSETTKKSSSTDDCPLIAYYLDVTQHGKKAQDSLLLLWAQVPVTGVVDLPVMNREFATSAVPQFDSAHGRYSYRFLSVFLV
jgi:hypothetical protein